MRAGKMKQFASWFTHGVRNGAQLRKAIYEASDEHQILIEVERFFERVLAESDDSGSAVEQPVYAAAPSAQSDHDAGARSARYSLSAFGDNSTQNV